MYQSLSQGSGNVLGYRCTGQITAAEVKEIHREIREALAEHEKIRILLHLAELDLPTAKSVWEDLKLLPAYVADVERYAIVGDARWHEWLSGLTDTFTQGESRHFQADRIEEAWDWLLDS